jgi:hypothetical protein
MLYTGVDQKKKVSVDYNPLKRQWKLSNREGKKIAVIPSDKVLIKREQLPEGLKKSDLRRYLKTKYGNFLFDFSLEGNFYTLVLVKDFKPPKDSFALDAEPFSLARIARVLNLPSLQILDFGRRKTTLVEVDNFNLKSYRVILRGGDYLTQKVAQNWEISPDEAEKIKIQRGLDLEFLKEAIEEILNNLPLKKDKPLLLSGGGSRLKGLREFLKEKGFNIVDFKVVSPEKGSALGAALKFVFKDNSPSFRRGEVTARDIKLFLASSALLLASFFIALWGLKRIETNFLQRLEGVKKELFAEKFPHLPPVAVTEQLKTMQGNKKLSVLPLLEKAFRALPKGVKIYRITYQRGEIRIRGEAPPAVVKELKVDNEKRLDNGNILFEVVVK